MGHIKPMLIGFAVTVTLGGAFICIPFLGYVERVVLATISILIGGFLAAYTTQGTNIDGGFHGAVEGFFAGTILTMILAAVSNLVRINSLEAIFGLFILGMYTGGLFFGFNFGIIGAVIGNIFRNKQKRKKNPGYLVCNKCGAYYELNLGESPEDFSLECDCGGKLVHNLI